MKIICCLDKKNGRMFNNRRQSMDAEVRKNIFQIIKDKSLYMNEYSFNQFGDYKGEIIVSNEFLSCAKEDDYCFVENDEITGKDINQIIVYRWDKVYPADKYLDVDLSDYELDSTLEFAGNSHEKIIREVYYEK